MTNSDTPVNLPQSQHVAHNQPIHATCVARDGRAVLITGHSGSGKSDLALRLIDRGWMLVADDYVHLTVDRDRLIASPPQNIAGRIEARHIGLLTVDYLQHAQVCLMITLSEQPERLPDPVATALHGIMLPVIALSPFEASAPIKAGYALNLYGLALD